MSTGSAPARVALAGNPSDGHGGAVVALTVPAFTATVTASSGRPRPDEPPLLLAARARFAARPPDDGDDDRPSPALTFATDIPREVGLAGSSAIVIAAMRALAAWHDATVEPLLLARLALEAETIELGLAAGPQDRVVQAVGGLVHMDFATPDWQVTALDETLLPPLYLAWLTTAAAPSDAWHSGLARRTDVGPVMARLAGHAHDARDALLAGDREGFTAALDASYDARTALGPLDPTHVALVETARAAGASANFAGSGGAIVGVPPATAEATAELVARLRALGAEVMLRDAAGWALAEPFQMTDGESMRAASRGAGPRTITRATAPVSPS